MTDDERYARDKDNGYSAFPTMGYSVGMTLRDYFAAQAMQAIVSKTCDSQESQDMEIYPKAVAYAAYLLSDAMLKAREPKKE